MKSAEEIKHRLEQDKQALQVCQSSGEESHDEHNIIGWIEALEWVLKEKTK